ncbi:Imm1 family immunity protein [Streptomyces sp. NPDC088090]|uniref:Imm1 family immunity protein n=1 Tax=Streptomyces sp. NPDC088090 TaxID=3365822 RepID=UPI0038515189
MALKVFGEEQFILKDEQEFSKFLEELFSPTKKTGYESLDFQLLENPDSETDNILGLGVDYDSGYGAAIWYCSGNIAKKVQEISGEEVANSVWVSWTATPPEVDPEIVRDPWSPTFFNRVSALPLEQVRKILESYFREGTGHRPTGVEWVKGHFTGELYEENDET